MFKKLIMIMAGLVMLGTLAACSSDYVIKTTDNQLIVTQGKPIIDPETGMISYKDQGGNDHQIKSSDIIEMIEK